MSCLTSLPSFLLKDLLNTKGLDNKEGDSIPSYFLCTSNPWKSGKLKECPKAFEPGALLTLILLPAGEQRKWSVNKSGYFPRAEDGIVGENKRIP